MGDTGYWNNLTGKQKTLIVVPPALLASTYIVFRTINQWIGPKTGYLAGFIFYWAFWCTLIPILTIGVEGIKTLFKSPTNPFGEPPWLGLAFILFPVLASFSSFSINKLQDASTLIVVVSIVFSIVNGTLEEVFWRGTYSTIFQDNWLTGILYPSIWFGLWHLSPQVIYPSAMPGGPIAFSFMAILLGLPMGWVANKTGSIRWVVISHILLDLSGLAGYMFL
jgi:membrane protease YdiL (CAAX protease family)